MAIKVEVCELVIGCFVLLVPFFSHSLMDTSKQFSGFFIITTMAFSPGAGECSLALALAQSYKTSCTVLLVRM